MCYIDIPHKDVKIKQYSKMTHLGCILDEYLTAESITAWKVSKYGAISAPYFPVFSPNTGKYGPEITPYLSTFHAVHGDASMHKNYDRTRVFT